MFRGRMREERFFGNRRRETSFHKGDLKYVVLDLIKDKPRHGYDVIRELEEQSYGLYKPSPGAVYPTLQMLEDLGYVVCKEQDGKKVYTITEQGLEFLAEQKELTDGVKDQMKHRWSFKNIGRMTMVMKEFHELENMLGRGFRYLDAEKTDKIRAVISQAYDEIEEILSSG